MSKNITKRIRELSTARPIMSVKEIAQTVKTSATYVYAVRKKFFNEFAGNNIVAVRNKVYPGMPVYEDSRLPNLSPKMLELVVQEIIDEQGLNPIPQPFDVPPSVVAAAKPKQRMQSSQIEMIEPQADPVNHPPHYKAGGIETIDFIEAKKLNYNLGNVVKYITRADLKGNRKQDLEKALWYLNRELSA